MQVRNKFVSFLNLGIHLMGLQLFDSSATDNFPAVKLSPEAKKLGNEQLSFLAFKDDPIPRKAIEYNRALDMKAISKGNKLDKDFGEPGVFNMLYKDVANPTAYGVDWNMDYGGTNKFADKSSGISQKEHQKVLNMDLPKTHMAKKSERAHASISDRENARKFKEFSRRSRGSAMTSKSGISKREPYNANGNKLAKDKIRKLLQDHRSELMQVPNMEKAYFDYGYQEEGFKNVKTPEKLSAVMMRDLNVCPPGNMWVDGYCVPEHSRAKQDKPVCPWGWELNDQGACTLVQKQL